MLPCDPTLQVACFKWLPYSLIPRVFALFVSCAYNVDLKKNQDGIIMKSDKRYLCVLTSSFCYKDYNLNLKAYELFILLISPFYSAQA